MQELYRYDVCYYSEEQKHATQSLNYIYMGCWVWCSSIQDILCLLCLRRNAFLHRILLVLGDI